MSEQFLYENELRIQDYLKQIKRWSIALQIAITAALIVVTWYYAQDSKQLIPFTVVCAAFFAITMDTVKTFRFAKRAEHNHKLMMQSIQQYGIGEGTH